MLAYGAGGGFVADEARALSIRGQRRRRRLIITFGTGFIQSRV